MASWSQPLKPHAFVGMVWQGRACSQEPEKPREGNPPLSPCYRPRMAQTCLKPTQARQAKLPRGLPCTALLPNQQSQLSSF